MSNCDSNCEAVAGLNEAAANLIQYRDLINTWLNGGQNQTVNIGGTNIKTLLGLAMDIKQLVGVWPDNVTIKIDSTTKKIYVPLKTNGGIRTGTQGLYVDSSDFLQLGGGLAKDTTTGQIYVDFEQMPTAKFDAILEKFRKGLRLPKWLTSNLSIFVDDSSTAASDSLDDGRGLSASKPFKTLQAAVNYVTENYNLSTHNVTIYVRTNTTYSGQLTLPDYQTISGFISIQPWSGSGTTIATTGRYKIKRTQAATSSGSTSAGLLCSGGLWNLYNADIDTDISTFTKSARAQSGIFQNNGRLSLYGVYVRTNLTDKAAIDALTFSESLSGVGLNIQGGSLFISPGDIFSVIEAEVATGITKTYVHTPISVSGNGVITIYGSNQTGKNENLFLKNRSMQAAAIASNGGKIIGAATGTEIDIMKVKMYSGYTATGRRYRCTGGGSMNINQGADYFPGALDGTVDAESYSWYK